MSVSIYSNGKWYSLSKTEVYNKSNEKFQKIGDLDELYINGEWYKIGYDTIETIETQINYQQVDEQFLTTYYFVFVFLNSFLYNDFVGKGFADGVQQPVFKCVHDDVKSPTYKTGWRVVIYINKRHNLT